MKLTELLASIFQSEKAVTDSAGQRTVTLDAILPDVEGYELFETSPEVEASTVEVDTPAEEIERIVEYATVGDMGLLGERISKLEALIRAADVADNRQDYPNVEVW